MNIISKIIVSGIASVLLVVSASAQEASLVGTWQHFDKGPPQSMYTVTYTPNGEIYSELAISPLPTGGGGGVVRTVGQYRMQGPTTVVIMYGQSMMCAGGLQCVPAYPPSAPQAGTTTSIAFQLHGDNQLVSQDGSVWQRIR